MVRGPVQRSRTIGLWRVDVGPLVQQGTDPGGVLLLDRLDQRNVLGRLGHTLRPTRDGAHEECNQWDQPSDEQRDACGPHLRGLPRESRVWRRALAIPRGGTDS